MFRRSQQFLKKGFRHNPGPQRSGAKNMAFTPKLTPEQLEGFLPLNLVHPPRIPNGWQKLEFERLGYKPWPKEVGFFNAGDNFEITPEMMYRLFHKNQHEAFWTPSHNEKAIIHQYPLVEHDPARYMPRVDEIFKAHVKRFGADHVVYNAVMQAAAFAKDIDRCEQLVEEMKGFDLVPNAQTIVNLMLAVHIKGEPKERAEAYFTEGVRIGALKPVMRLDTEFKMWWDQIERMGSFTSGKGFLSSKEEGAKPMPKDMWALWGWDRDERKFADRKERIQHEVDRRVNTRTVMRGTVYTKYHREPWAKYRGLFPWDTRKPFTEHRPHWDTDRGPFSDRPPVSGSVTGRGVTIEPPKQ